METLLGDGFALELIGLFLLGEVFDVPKALELGMVRPKSFTRVADQSSGNQREQVTGRILEMSYLPNCSQTSKDLPKPKTPCSATEVHTRYPGLGFQVQALRSVCSPTPAFGFSTFF